MSKWTKKDIKSLCGAISTFWLYNRPLGSSAREALDAAEAVRRHLAEHRAEIIIAGIAELRGIAEDRTRQNQETADHFAAHPEIYGSSTPEMIKRFSDLAADNRKAVTRMTVLIARIEAEGLPPEVEAFDPTARG
jgi:hypothetical protein